jgi:hypothetical protein
VERKHKHEHGQAKSRFLVVQTTWRDDVPYNNSKSRLLQSQSLSRTSGPHTLQLTNHGFRWQGAQGVCQLNIGLGSNVPVRIQWKQNKYKETMHRPLKERNSFNKLLGSYEELGVHTHLEYMSVSMLWRGYEFTYFLLRKMENIEGLA